MNDSLYLVCWDCKVALAWSANYNTVAPYLFGSRHEGHRMIAVRSGSQHLKHCKVFLTYQPQSE